MRSLTLNGRLLQCSARWVDRHHCCPVCCWWCPPLLLGGAGRGGIKAEMCRGYCMTTDRGRGPMDSFLSDGKLLLFCCTCSGGSDNAPMAYNSKDKVVSRKTRSHGFVLTTNHTHPPAVVATLIIIYSSITPPSNQNY